MTLLVLQLLPLHQPHVYFMSDSNDSIWGSLTDSMMNKALEKIELKNKAKQVSKVEFVEDVRQSDVAMGTDADTDVETEKDNDNDNDNNSKDEEEVIEKEWTTMNDSQFISFVNKISQNHAVNSTNIIDSDNNISALYPIAAAQKSSKSIKSSTSQLQSSPIQLAQHTPTVSDFEDYAVEEILENAEDYAFDDHKGYFEAKSRKQQQQGENLAAFLKETTGGKQYPSIFKNCRIHVNGRTDPDLLQLRKLIVLYGGIYMHYLSSKGSVTHIVAESLPPRKRIQYGSCKVVSPKWIVESIEQEKLLNWADYRLEQLGDYGQKTLAFTKFDEKNDVTADHGKECNGGIDFADDAEDVKVLSEEQKDTTESDIDTANKNGKETLDAEREELQYPEIEKQLDEIDNMLSQELSKRRIDANHPEFLPMFFAKSRLHHLSTWKSDLQSKFLNKALLKLKSYKRMHIPRQRVILHVDFDCFFATVSAKYQNPPIDINSVPCCVTHGGSSADIASCNYVARSFGVRNGMWMSRAKSLCPDIVTMPYHFDAYEKISNLFYDHLMSLDVDSILPVSIDEALVDISTICENEDVEDVIRKTKTALDRITGCSLSLGAGKNVLLAKLALRKAKPNGVYHVADNSQVIEDFLNDISVTKLPGFGDKLFQKLRPMFYNAKVITLQSLRSLELAKLTATFGMKTGEKLYNSCRGLDDTSIDVTLDPEKYQRKSLNIDVNWGIRFQADDEVEVFLYRMAGELCKRLLNIDMIGSMLTLKLSIRHPDAPLEPAKYMGMGRCTFCSKSSRLGVATREVGVVSSELKYLWRFFNIDPKELRGVGVGMVKLKKPDFTSVKFDNQMKLDFTVNKKLMNNNKLHDQTTKNNIDFKPHLPPVIPEHEVTDSNIEKMLCSTPRKKRTNANLMGEEIDWEVFQHLPPDMQVEIKDELRRRNLQASPKRSKLLRKNDIVNLLSPTKRTPQRQSSRVFPYVSPEKIKEQKEAGLVFQGISVNNEATIVEKLIYWMDFTLIDDGPFDERDLDLFNDFMVKLVTTNELLLFIRITRRMKFHLKFNEDKIGYTKWSLVLENLDQLIKEESFTRFEFTF